MNQLWGQDPANATSVQQCLAEPNGLTRDLERPVADILTVLIGRERIAHGEGTSTDGARQSVCEPCSF